MKDCRWQGFLWGKVLLPVILCYTNRMRLLSSCAVTEMTTEVFFFDNKDNRIHFLRIFSESDAFFAVCALVMVFIVEYYGLCLQDSLSL